ncbi:hypothetical protein BLNAU_6098 [Blattamonas nauphoetae]|uniref:Helix-turn-helix domain-containing protein n=1 Tax=Blattamonas nauphoetae TaxID=2049346 RepID=A0ABQ9Y572_9EUKA|nr:hypothetical protein BLNAU_6098 [Blattamonas nauphoetae]
MDLAQRGAALALHRLGKNNSEIARELGVPRSTVQSFISLHKDDPISDEVLADRPLSGRPRGRTERQDRHLGRRVRNDPPHLMDEALSMERTTPEHTEHSTLN